MKIEWQPEDIRPDRIVAKPGRTERWMIGYIGHGGDYALVSMTDGMICNKMSAQEMAASLNKDGDYPAEFVDASKQKAS